MNWRLPIENPEDGEIILAMSYRGDLKQLDQFDFKFEYGKVVFTDDRNHWYISNRKGELLKNNMIFQIIAWIPVCEFDYPKWFALA